ncbi:hypothetical protein K461DRAFT_13292 [Myriangium duriaei CBS 260.36]|uniref:Uncharacterized protein n=1 Tax=Myriangium duriaei CBS 260.36 TaxID=1168546 RepID=A0A9P4JCQ9_9PEZI|nr:hypothetical protein K461DRAFT_13292 [Myriangium duriaei CBS 260.36]
MMIPRYARHVARLYTFGSGSLHSMDGHSPFISSGLRSSNHQRAGLRGHQSRKLVPSSTPASHNSNLCKHKESTSLPQQPVSTTRFPGPRHVLGGLDEPSSLGFGRLTLVTGMSLGSIRSQVLRLHAAGTLEEILHGLAVAPERLLLDDLVGVGVVDLDPDVVAVVEVAGVRVTVGLLHELIECCAVLIDNGVPRFETIVGLDFGVGHCDDCFGGVLDLVRLDMRACDARWKVELACGIGIQQTRALFICSVLQPLT